MRDVGEGGGSVDFNELNIHGHLIRGLRYTDDTILLSHCARGLSYLVETLRQNTQVRGTQREYSSKPLKHSIVKRILVFKR